MPKVVVGTVSLLSVLLLVANACAASQKAPEAPAAAPQKATPGLSAKPAWEQDWENTLREARKEERVVVYTGFGAEWRAALAEAISKKYGITVDAMTARSAELAERIMREQKNRAYQADIVVVGSSQYQLTFKPEGVVQSLEKVLVLPEVVDPNAWFRGELPWFDADKSYFQFHAYVIPSLVVNTELVKPEDVRSWKDLLNPRWKGKIVIDDPTAGSGSGVRAMTMFAYSIMDWDYVNNLVKQEPILSRDIRQMVEWVARGKYSMVIGAQEEVPYEFIKAGAPIRQVVPSEGSYLSAGYGFVSQPKGAPHPNAAKVFINFLLTKEGQTLSSRASGSQSARVDVPADHLNPVTVRQPGVKYVTITDKEFVEQEVELKRRVAEIFKPLSK